MDKHQNFAENLRAIRKSKNLSITAFAKELNIPKSTLQSVLNAGQTTLDTAIRISESLNLSIDTLTDVRLGTQTLDLVKTFIDGSKWFDNLPTDSQKEVLLHLSQILEVLQK